MCIYATGYVQHIDLVNVLNATVAVIPTFDMQNTATQSFLLAYITPAALTYITYLSRNTL